MKTLMQGAIYWLATFLVIHGEPSDMVVDDKVYRHGTYDRIWKPQAVYVNKSGALYLPSSNDLQAVERKEVERILSLFPGERREKFELRIYIHPNASWKDINEFIAWISNQNIGHLSFRVAELKAKDPAVK